MKKIEDDEVQDVRCPECNYFTTTEDLVWAFTDQWPIATCPECGHEFESKEN